MVPGKTPIGLTEQYLQPRFIDQVGEIIGGVALYAAVGGTGSKSMVDALSYQRIERLSGQAEGLMAIESDTDIISQQELAPSDLSPAVGYYGARTALEIRAALDVSNHPLESPYYGVHPQGQVR